MKRFIIFSSILCITLFHSTSLQAQGDNIRGRDCRGGLGLCGDISIEKVALETKNSETENFIKLVLPQHYFSETELKQIVAKDEDVFFSILKQVELEPKTLTKLKMPYKKKYIKPQNYLVHYKDEKIYIKVELEEQ